MSAATERSAEQALAEGFAGRILRWARERHAPEASLDALQAAARAASLATAAGHVCADLADVAAAAGRRAALLDSGVVGTPADAGAHPLILDGDGRLYLHRYFDYEQRLARRLVRALCAAPRGIDPQARRVLDSLFPEDESRRGGPPDWRKLACALALDRTLTIISGGPGTGKTTTVVNVLACALAANPACRIALAAPTGKAAARLLDALRESTRHWPAARTAGLPAASTTVHRLLGATAERGRFRHHAGNLLPIDLLVVDEASLLDLALATRLLEAVPPAAQIILLGDKDQLAAVESGAVFSELSAAPRLSEAAIAQRSAATGNAGPMVAAAAPVESSPLRDSVVWLTRNFRFAEDSGIGALAGLVKRGDELGALNLLRSHDDPALHWLEDETADLQAATRGRMSAGLAPYLHAVRANADSQALFAAFARFRVLCAERQGRRGVNAVNDMLGAHFRRALDHPETGWPALWYPGRPVMVLRNDDALQLANGDVGIVLAGAAGTPMVIFPDGGNGFRAVSPLRLPAHETAFATTVHKAQGSEFDDVLLVLPAKPGRLATRELLYTAITRARSGFTLVAGSETLIHALHSPTRRYSGLVARMAEAGAAT